MGLAKVFHDDDDCKVIGEDDFEFRVSALYHRLDGFPDAVKAHKCLKQVQVSVQSIDLTNSVAMEQLQKKLQEKEKEGLVVVIHTAAMSSPRLCQQDPEMAKAVNIPIPFFTAMKSYPMIALSSDQVYDGKRAALYKEEEVDGLKPVNVYGQSKLEMEQYLQKQHQISQVPLFLLRYSIILGPPAPLGGAHGTFLDFCKTRENQETTFFTNEYRSVVSVQHVVNVINDMIVHCCKCLYAARANSTAAGATKTSTCKTPVIFNMGGPFRVNRWDMAKAVFDHFGYDDKVLLKAEQSSPESPLDISMDSSLLQQYSFGGTQKPETMQEMVEYVFRDEMTKQRNG